jgi:hypothetical protein
VSAPPVVIVNKALADTYWPGQDPIGKRIAVLSLGLGDLSASSEPRYAEVIGVVENIKQQGLDRLFEPDVYLSFLQDATYRMFRGM